MKIASWNVNSLRARHDLVIDWVRRQTPDVLCLQETKVVDDAFPTDEFQRLGYSIAMAGQKTYNGVALVSRHALKDVQVGLVNASANADKRLIAATVQGIRVYSVYVPNGKSVDSPSFEEKLGWLASLKQTLEQDPFINRDLVIAGDFNIAADERDVYSVEVMQGRVHFHPQEHAALDELKQLGLKDAYRLHHSEGGQYSWWDYRGASLRRNEGLRIDYLWVTEPLAARCADCFIDAEERKKDKPSDHVPVVARFVDKNS